MRLECVLYRDNRKSRWLNSVITYGQALDKACGCERVLRSVYSGSVLTSVEYVYCLRMRFKNKTTSFSVAPKFNLYYVQHYSEKFKIEVIESLHRHYSRSSFSNLKLHCFLLPVIFYSDLSEISYRCG